MGSGFRTFSPGEVLTAARVQDYLMDQAVMSFASAAARDAAITAPEEGMLAYTADTDIYWSYTNAAWVAQAYAGSWTTYTPAWTSSGTAPAIGNGTLSGAYKREGKTITFRATLTAGTTTTYGTGQYSLSLPVATAITASAQNIACHFLDASAPEHWFGACTVAGTTAAFYIYIGTANGSMRTLSGTQPVTMTTGDKFECYGTYELV